MNENKHIKPRQERELQASIEKDVYLRPAADIYEDSMGITLTADLPGVTRERLNIEIDKDTLVIEGQASLDVPEGMEAFYADVRATRYQRRFILDGALDIDKISASMKDGVLTLKIPKRAERQPRKIQVTVG